MRQAGLAAVAIVVLWASPAGAPVVCPDETGEYTPDACDLIEPFDPLQERHMCDIIDLMSGRLDQICIAYWRWEAETDPDVRAMLEELLRVFGRRA
jgi:hypothetical protein